MKLPEIDSAQIDFYQRQIQQEHGTLYSLVVVEAVGLFAIEERVKGAVPLEHFELIRKHHKRVITLMAELIGKKSLAGNIAKDSRNLFRIARMAQIEESRKKKGSSDD